MKIKIKKLPQGGEVPLDPTYQALSKVFMERNKDLNFVDRAMNPLLYPVIDRGNGYESTHIMTYSSVDDDEGVKGYVYPEIIYQDGKLNWLSKDDAADHAFDNKQYIETPTEKMAHYLSSRGYKQYPDGGKLEPLQYFESYINSDVFKNRIGTSETKSFKDAKISYLPIGSRAYFPNKRPDENTLINIDTYDDREGNFDSATEVLPHEIGHLIQNSSNMSNFWQKEILKRNKLADYYNLMQKYPLGENVNTFVIKQELKNNVPMHDARPEESYGDLSALRYLMYNEGIYDTRKRDMTKEDLEKAKKIKT